MGAVADKDTISTGIEALDEALEGDKPLDLSVFVAPSPRTNLTLGAMRAALAKGATVVSFDLEMSPEDEAPPDRPITTKPGS
jgi:replicative DNA helicase